MKNQVKQAIKEAVSFYGKTVVKEVMSMVKISDPDGMYTIYQDMGMDVHAECVEFIYFTND